jgi:hypothetical protein
VNARRGLALALVGPGERLEPFLVDEDRFFIGRAKDCQLRLYSAAIGRRHALVEHTAAGWTIRHLGCSGGTFLGEGFVPLDGPHLLAVGDILKLGDQMIHVLDLDYEAAPGELLPGMDKRVALRCPGMICELDVHVGSRTSSRFVEADLAKLVAGDRDVRVDGATTWVTIADPVAAVMAFEELRLRLDQADVGNVRATVGIEAAHLDADALALLREPGAPARAAWELLRRGCLHGLVAPHEMLLGVSYGPRGLPAIVDVVRAPGVGLAWIHGPWIHELVRMPHELVIPDKRAVEVVA